MSLRAAEEGVGKTVLVTGASGYIGGWCIRMCLERGYKVRGTCRKISPKYDYLKAYDKSGDSLSLVVADLTKDDGWNEAIAGVDYVIHTANPMPGTLMTDAKTGRTRKPSTDEDFILPAKDGIERILRACDKSGTVKRLIFTSSVGSINWEKWDDPNTFGRPMWSTANEWTPTQKNCYVSPYAKSKTVSEEIALQYCRQKGVEFDCISIIPAFVLGPWLGPNPPDSVQLGILDFMEGKQPPVSLPVQNAVVDVRDVALAHVNALTEGTPGERYLLAGECLWFSDIFKFINSEFAEEGLMAPRVEAPMLMIDILSMIDINARNFVQSMAMSRRFIDNTPSQKDLDIVYTPSQDTIRDTVTRAFADGSRQSGTDFVSPIVKVGQIGAVAGLGYALVSKIIPKIMGK